MEATTTWRATRSGHVVWERNSKFLFARLPSGRRLSYPNPELKSVQTSWGATRVALTFESVSQYTRQWSRQSTYGGMIVENLVQAIARDIMAEAMLRCEESKLYAPVLSVHDELISEADEDKGDVKEYEQLLMTLPEWAAGCPIAAEGYRTKRYRK